ncbi:MAG: ComEC/Rec2 family competence protein [Ruminococcus sp.]
MKQNHSVKISFLCFLSLLFSLLILCSCSHSASLNSETPSEPQKDMLNVHFLDIGQGDSIFIELPDEKTMLIDAGENYHGEGIKDYIGDCGYSRVDYLVATHPHADHIGSMPYIVRNMDIGSVYMPKAAANTKTYENLLESISDKGLKITSAKAGLTIAEESDYTINVVAPVTIDEDNLNNSSAVIKLTYKDNTFLFTGDAEEKELETINADISADVLKVGHHGSVTSTTEEFLNAVNPTYAVISAGEDNSYGHPHKETLDLLEEFNCKIYRTDIDKTVLFSSDGKTISVKSGEMSIKKAG